MRQKIIIGNWKMNKTSAEAIRFVQSVQPIVEQSLAHHIELGVAPSFLSLAGVKGNEGKLFTVAQNCHFADNGAFTGEVSVPMLKELGIKFVLIGHSERRQFFGETNETCNQKLKQLVNHGLIPVYCVGETLSQFEGNQTDAVVKTQLQIGLKEIPALAVKSMVIAYEPVWSIGTGKNADSQIAERVCRLIRNEIATLYSKEVAESVRIQYGGSVKPANIKEYLSQPDIDGALVGGASLKEDSFGELVTNLF